MLHASVTGEPVNSNTSGAIGFLTIELPQGSLGDADITVFLDGFVEPPTVNGTYLIYNRTRVLAFNVTAGIDATKKEKSTGFSVHTTYYNENATTYNNKIVTSGLSNIRCLGGRLPGWTGLNTDTTKWKRADFVDYDVDQERIWIDNLRDNEIFCRQTLLTQTLEVESDGLYKVYTEGTLMFTPASPLEFVPFSSGASARKDYAYVGRLTCNGGTIKTSTTGVQGCVDHCRGTGSCNSFSWSPSTPTQCRLFNGCTEAGAHKADEDTQLYTVIPTSAGLDVRTRKQLEPSFTGTLHGFKCVPKPGDGVVIEFTDFEKNCTEACLDAAGCTAVSYRHGDDNDDADNPRCQLHYQCRNYIRGSYREEGGWLTQFMADQKTLKLQVDQQGPLDEATFHQVTQYPTPQFIGCKYTNKAAPKIDAFTRYSGYDGDVARCADNCKQRGFPWAVIRVRKCFCTHVSRNAFHNGHVQDEFMNPGRASNTNNDDAECVGNDELNRPSGGNVAGNMFGMGAGYVWAWYRAQLQVPQEGAGTVDDGSTVWAAGQNKLQGLHYFGVSITPATSVCSLRVMATGGFSVQVTDFEGDVDSDTLNKDWQDVLYVPGVTGEDSYQQTIDLGPYVDKRATWTGVRLIPDSEVTTFDHFSVQPCIPEGVESGCVDEAALPFAPLTTVAYDLSQCQQECINLGHRYYGMQDALCRCANHLEGATDMGTCQPCVTDPGLLCGDNVTNAYSVYETQALPVGSTTEVLGCVAVGDNWSVGPVNRPFLEPSSCSLFCAESGYRFAGVQRLNDDMAQCYCDDVYGAFGRMHGGDCSDTINGFPAGGPQAISIYPSFYDAGAYYLPSQVSQIEIEPHVNLVAIEARHSGFVPILTDGITGCANSPETTATACGLAYDADTTTCRSTNRASLHDYVTFDLPRVMPLGEVRIVFFQSGPYAGVPPTLWIGDPLDRANAEPCDFIQKTALDNNQPLGLYNCMGRETDKIFVSGGNRITPLKICDLKYRLFPKHPAVRVETLDGIYTAHDLSMLCSTASELGWNFPKFNDEHWDFAENVTEFWGTRQAIGKRQHTVTALGFGRGGTDTMYCRNVLDRNRALAALEARKLAGLQVNAVVGEAAKALTEDESTNMGGSAVGPTEKSGTLAAELNEELVAAAAYASIVTFEPETPVLVVDKPIFKLELCDQLVEVDCMDNIRLYDRDGNFLEYSPEDVSAQVSFTEVEIQPGYYKRTWKIPDLVGVDQVFNQFVYVVDPEPPKLSSLPEDYSFECHNCVETTLVRPTIQVADNCDPEVKLTAFTFEESRWVYLTRLNKELYEAITQEVIDARREEIARVEASTMVMHVIHNWTAEDAEGNINSHAQTITVEDNTPPKVLMVTPIDALVLESYTAAPTNGFIYSEVPAEKVVECSAEPVFPDQLTELLNGTASLVRHDAAENYTADDGCFFLDDAELVGYTEELLPPPVDEDGNPLPVCVHNRQVLRTWTAQDSMNHTTTVTQTYSVVDSSVPEVHVPLMTCAYPPNDQWVEISQASLALTNTASDNCSPVDKLTVTFTGCNVTTMTEDNKVSTDDGDDSPWVLGACEYDAVADTLYIKASLDQYAWIQGESFPRRYAVFMTVEDECGNKVERRQNYMVAVSQANIPEVCVADGNVVLTPTLTDLPDF